jgi:hypothetical protein
VGIDFAGQKRRRFPTCDPAGVTVTHAAGVAYEVLSPAALLRSGCEKEAG